MASSGIAFTLLYEADSYGEIGNAKRHFRQAENTRLLSYYEAERDGFG